MQQSQQSLTWDERLHHRDQLRDARYAALADAEGFPIICFALEALGVRLLRCKGDQLAILAKKNGWEGAVVYGCIRDSGDINEIDIGVRALNTHPQKSIKKGAGDRNIPVTFGGVTFNPGEWLYADEDGVLLSANSLLPS